MSYLYDFSGLGGPLWAVFVVLNGIFLVAALLGLVAYLLSSLGVSRLAYNRGIPHSWLAWVPLAGLYILGCIADDIAARRGERPTYYRILLLVLSVVSAAGGLIPLVGGIAAALCGVALYVFQAIAFYAIYRDYAPGSAVPMLLLSILLPLGCVFLFAIRNRQPITLGGSSYDN